MSKVDELKAEIEAKRLELEKLEKSLSNNARNEAIKDLSEFTDAEKIAQFDTLYESSLSVVNEVEERGYMNEDTPEYIYEEMMSIIARDSSKFWKYFNSLQ